MSSILSFLLCSSLLSVSLFSRDLNSSKVICGEGVVSGTAGGISCFVTGEDNTGLLSLFSRNFVILLILLKSLAGLLCFMFTTY